MEDEVQQTAQEAFDRIVWGLALAGLAGGLLVGAIEGVSSPWFLRAIALLIVVLVALILRRVGQFVIAAYVLVLELLGIVAGMFFETDTPTSFIPYLFIPIIIIASLILTPGATLTVALFAIGLALAIILTTGQFTPANFFTLLPPFGLSLLTAFLTALSGRYLLRLGQRLSESSNLLRERTLEWLSLMEQVKELQATVARLEEQLGRAKAETGQARRLAIQNERQGLIQGALQGLKGAVRKLERMVETIAEIPTLEAQPNLVNETWGRLDELTRLVIRLEELIQLENEDLRLESQAVDVAQLLGEVVGATRGLAREKHLELRYASQPLPPLQADPARLRQALLHVLDNAVKYTHQGVIEVQTELTERELIIFVSDTGMGMPVEKVETLFQASGPDNKRQAQPQSGPGLGLTITRRLVELHGGRIWASSVPGVGSTISIALPLYPAQPDRAGAMLAAEPLPGAIAARNPSPALVVRPASEPPELISSTSEETMISTRSPLERASAPASLSSAIQRSRQARNAPSAPASKSGAVKASPQTALGPVARFSPVYINRFGLTLLSLLLAVIGIVAILAWINGPIVRKATATPLAKTGAGPVSTGGPKVNTNLTPANISATPLSPTQTSSPTRLPTATSSPSAAFTPIGAKPIPAQLSPTPETPAASRRTPSPIPPAGTALSTVEASGTKTQTGTLQVEETPAPAAAPSPTTTPAAAFEPTRATRPGPPDLSFIARYPIAPAITLLNFDAGSGLGLAAITDAAANSSLSWRAGRVLFSSEANGNRDIYLAQAGRDSPLNLTPVEGDDLQPAWSPDGRQFAFSSGRSGNLDIYVMKLECLSPPGGCNSSLVQLTTDRGFDEWPAWSPDGQHLAFVSDRDGNVEIYLMTAAGGNQRRLTHHPADDWPAAWSPDGRRLVFASNRDGNWNLYILEISGGEPVRLTNDPGDEREPVWSPDGRTIAFTYNVNENWDIYTLPAPTGPVSEVPGSAWTHAALTAADEHYPVWLPSK